MDAAVVAENVTKRYGDTVAVDDVSVSVPAGTVFGLIGPNGAGKTSLVRCLTGTTAYDGDVSLLGSAPEQVERARIGLLPQSFSPPERLTVRELFGYYANLYDEAREVDSVVSEVGLEDAADTWYEELSGGQQRRACVGITLVNDPDVLFLDEPTTGIDPTGRRDLWTLIEQLAAEGTTVFLTSHSMDEVERLADQVAMLADGRMIAEGTPSALVAEHGGDSRLVVRTEANADPLADAGFRVEASAGRLTLHGVDATRIDDAVDALAAAGIDYESFTWTQPTLEDVYLELTGRSFRGEGVTAAATEQESTAPGDAGTAEVER
ncbi:MULTISPECIES: ABC transporter ATP-binding protein [Halolamina]|uniref:ABC-2 type transport system ATP-binding protein n=1 Tax=Halolamina pelagica TaxID=699431 RepID=A0A1I5MRF6_9EURY|nr:MULTISPECIES: ABC transporter ATP-binding protein [Halolamina]NHX36110.1 ABC transporter ATP-binding protein [Halolamina sp. R1-12]SFP11531.1 ABC-2 type transport system ATP-binding protein [Halolamina pelagica]